jgi:hypothetical protein
MAGLEGSSSIAGMVTAGLHGGTGSFLGVQG